MHTRTHDGGSLFSIFTEALTKKKKSQKFKNLVWFYLDGVFAAQHRSQSTRRSAAEHNKWQERAEEMERKYKKLIKEIK